MSILINNNRQKEYQTEEIEDADKGTIGDVLAISIVGFYTLSSLVISSWSAILLFSNSAAAKSPIGLLFDSIKASGLV